MNNFEFFMFYFTVKMSRLAFFNNNFDKLIAIINEEITFFTKLYGVSKHKEMITSVINGLEEELNIVMEKKRKTVLKKKRKAALKKRKRVAIKKRRKASIKKRRRLY